MSTSAGAAGRAHLARLRGARLLPYAAALVLGLLGLVEAWSDPGFRPMFGSLAVVAAWISIGFLVATTWPAAGAVVVAAFYPLSTVLGAPGPGGTGLIAVLVAVAWAGYAAQPRRSRAALVIVIGLFIAADAVKHGISWDTVFFPAIFVPAWWTGTLVRREQERSRQLTAMAAEIDAQREATAHAAVVEERARIAREVHDSVAHSVSVMTLQIGGLRRQLADVLWDRPVERDVMLGLERLGRQSVEELRAAVGILRDESEDSSVGPASLARAEQLVSDVRAAGLNVSLVVEGELAGLPRGLDVAAYRVVQEALTNVLRHAPAATAIVRVTRGDDELSVLVTDDGRGARPSEGAGSDGPRANRSGRPVGGHGLVGLRERTEMFGGSLAAGPGAHGGFEVAARFPLDRRWS
ncbi:histidine kinase [Intrasporangium oryzae NRRL B-24470]|uniref:histidine kinase n=1 Tax=Intrasporangium oryzae NRRL B-24470 TaxID=1386089 RepID=W9G9Z3_9MICO|nr:sensor histidine kinase [Intrasporangium oryzae]EWT02037.1 histidine kinase [Intrasporangium oryzae NRRL B-24470]